MKDYKQEFEDNNHILLDVFGGADNSTFANYLFGMRDIAEKATHGDVDAQQICEHHAMAARLVKVFNKK